MHLPVISDITHDTPKLSQVAEKRVGEQIYEGTNQIQRMVMARQLLK
jgi:hypothetical protein